MRISDWSSDVCSSDLQQGKYVANLIGRRLKGKPADGPFKYRHQGNLATIGRSLAVIDMGRVKLRGAFAWWIWKLAHIYFLIGKIGRASCRDRVCQYV